MSNGPIELAGMQGSRRTAEITISVPARITCTESATANGVDVKPLNASYTVTVIRSLEPDGVSPLLATSLAGFGKGGTGGEGRQSIARAARVIEPSITPIRQAADRASVRIPSPDESGHT